MAKRTTGTILMGVVEKKRLLVFGRPQVFEKPRTRAFIANPTVKAFRTGVLPGNAWFGTQRFHFQSARLGIAKQ